MSILNNTNLLNNLLEQANALPDVVNIDSELSEQDNLIEQIQTALVGKAAGGDSSGDSGGVSTIAIAIGYGADAYYLWCEDGMTWGDLVDSKYNIAPYRYGVTSMSGFRTILSINGNYVSIMNDAYRFVSTASTSSSRVKISDMVIDGTFYPEYWDD